MSYLEAILKWNYTPIISKRFLYKELMVYRFIKLFNVKLSEGDALNMSIATLDYAINFILNIEEFHKMYRAQ